MISGKKIGLALSGGGYRAAVYHLGALRTLKDLGVLEHVDRLSTISGGSITGAAYCLHSGNFDEFEKKMLTILTTKNVIRFILTSWIFIRLALLALLILGIAVYLQFTEYAIISIPIIVAFVVFLIRYQFILFPVSRIIEKAYDKYFFVGATLSQLCDMPELVIGSTNLQTARPFTFSKRKMADSTYEHLETPVLFEGAKFPVTRAVMASSCVPFAFTPITIDKAFFKCPEQYDTIDPKLVDGGVYDNQGAHKLTQKQSSYKCDYVIVSDAGDKLPFKKSYTNTFTLLIRTVDLFMARIKHFQMIANLYSKSKISTSFQSIGWNLDSCIKGFYNNLEDGNIERELYDFHELNPIWYDDPKSYQSEIVEHLKARCNFAQIKEKELTEEQLVDIRNVGTNLTPIKPERAKNLMTHASLITELQIRLYCPQIITNYAI